MAQTCDFWSKLVTFTKVHIFKIVKFAALPDWIFKKIGHYFYSTHLEFIGHFKLKYSYIMITGLQKKIICDDIYPTFYNNTASIMSLNPHYHRHILASPQCNFDLFSMVPHGFNMVPLACYPLFSCLLELWPFSQIFSILTFY